ncbi:linear amide C-N hydrolase [Nodularia sp. NIES-3585]|uniref:linear amide C-N hydrolase n=1 Tax=Nodularia sp. NIES-3585 TaxID=1973477 RepID=UPI000B5CB67E|nr:linear amide C-N hydrolase [Nodularia sp. NIES-3585]GAX35677.1 hypothetical protein NIES3585_16950 [Nodularia sp. NIES-3585]
MKFNVRTLSLAIPSLLVGIATVLVWDITPESWKIHQLLSHALNNLHIGLIPLLLLGCTRAIYEFDDNSFITVRSMDWSDPNMSLSLWASLSGKQRVGAHPERKGEALTWESKYSSVVVCCYGMATTDGMNEKGLVTNLHFLPTAYYGEYNLEDGRPRLALSAWAQYVLDNYATVKEAVEDLKNEEFTLFTRSIPFLSQGENPGVAEKGKAIVLHLGISDADGDSAILQYVKKDGQSSLNIYHAYEHDDEPKYRVMTNSPYEDQIEIIEEFKDKGWNTQDFSWDALKTQTLGGTIVKEMTPPMNGANIRFIRASFFTDMLEKINIERAFLKENPQKEDDFFTEPWSQEEGIARAFSLIRNMSTPLNVKSLDNPFLSSTLWRSVADQKNKLYFLETTRSIYPIYVNLTELFQDMKDSEDPNKSDTYKLVLSEPPTEKDGPRVDLQVDQMKDKKKIGLVNEEFEPSPGGAWFDFDPDPSLEA